MIILRLIKRYNIRITILVLLFFAILVRTSIPFTKYFFYPFILIAFLFTLIDHKFRLKSIFNSFKSLPLIAVHLVIFLIALIITNDISVDLVKESINFIIIVLIGILFISNINYISELKFFYLCAIKITIYFSGALSIIGLAKFILELKGIEIPFLFVNNIYPFGSSLIPDYNFYSLVSLFGIIALIYNNIVERFKIYGLLQYFFILTLSLSVFLSASRRANIILFVVILLVFIFIIYYHAKNKKLRKIDLKNINRLKHYLFIFITFIAFFLLSLRYSSLENKHLFIYKLNLKASKCQFYSTNIFLKFGSIFKNVEYNEVYSSLWHDSIDPKDPMTGWGNGDYTMVSDLQGMGLTEVPIASKGIQIDNQVNHYLYGNNCYYTSFILRANTNTDLYYKSKIYCFVSKDFDGDEVSLIANFSNSNKKYAYYNLNNKGIWQELLISFFGDKSTVDLNFVMRKDSVINFSNLKGHVIFAHPIFESIKINPKEPNTWTNNNYKEAFPLFGKNSEIVPVNTKGCILDKESSLFFENTSSKYAYSFLTYGNSIVPKNYELRCEVFAYATNDFNGNIVMLMTQNGTRSSQYNLSQAGKWQKLSMTVPGNDLLEPIYFYFSKYGVTNFDSLKGNVIFAYPTYTIIKINDSLSSRLLNKTNVEHKYQYAGMFFQRLEKNELYNDSNNGERFKLIPGQNSFSGPRIDHWKYAWYLYKNEYSLIQKLIGGGFDYTTKFTETFSVEKPEYDYPHNPFFSVLLYSGLIGFALYLLLLYRVIEIYWTYRKDYILLFVFWSITFFFSFFSSNNPFDPVIMGFFMVLPFIIHYIHQKDEKNEEEKKGLGVKG